MGEAIVQVFAGTDQPVVASHFSTMLEKFAEAQTADRIQIGVLVRAMEHRSVGALVLILALPMVVPIPAPGISVPFGIFLMLVSTELMFARGQVWLPQRIAARSIARKDFVRFAERAVPVLRRVEQFARPRMAGFTRGWGIRIVGFTCLILATIIALPIPMGAFFARQRDLYVGHWAHRMRRSADRDRLRGRCIRARNRNLGVGAVCETVKRVVERAGFELIGRIQEQNVRSVDMRQCRIPNLLLNSCRILEGAMACHRTRW
ncbi:MAG: exopolysaccharide biosynthesis protein [Alphaproteobacteria bacterium]|nr:exopolysaccharide biosynthesis protein [Alphaproteobacteria bacterium]